MLDLIDPSICDAARTLDQRVVLLIAFLTFYTAHSLFHGLNKYLSYISFLSQMMRQTCEE